MPGLGMTYNVENRMVQAVSNLNGTESYGYDPGGLRVWKQGPDGVLHVFYNGLDGKPLVDFTLASGGAVQGGTPMVYFAGKRVDNGSVEDRLGTAGIGPFTPDITQRRPSVPIIVPPFLPTLDCVEEALRNVIMAGEVPNAPNGGFGTLVGGIVVSGGDAYGLPPGTRVPVINSVIPSRRLCLCQRTLQTQKRECPGVPLCRVHNRPSCRCSTRKLRGNRICGR